MLELKYRDDLTLVISDRFDTTNALKQFDKLYVYYRHTLIKYYVLLKGEMAKTKQKIVSVEDISFYFPKEVSKYFTTEKKQQH